jgi:SAM-dependent methyltransferase
MGTSYAEQIPQIIHVVQQLRPRRVLDVGKGFGKYGLLLHEFAGLDTSKRVEPSLPLKMQSSLTIDAVEIDSDLILPHLDQLYSEVFFGDVTEIQNRLPRYDLILMVDVIEHIAKPKGEKLLREWIRRGEAVLISTPISFFRQHLFQSPHEEHVSYWCTRDFRQIGHTIVQYVGPSALFLISPQPINIRGFGNGLMHRLRRCARFIRNETRW